jgi:hypothetical protein
MQQLRMLYRFTHVYAPIGVYVPISTGALAVLVPNTYDCMVFDERCSTTEQHNHILAC